MSLGDWESKILKNHQTTFKKALRQVKLFLKDVDLFLFDVDKDVNRKEELVNED